MNMPQNEALTEVRTRGEERSTNLPDGLFRNAAPIGTFAGQQDFVVRFHDGKPVAMNSGEQGGGQN